LETYIRSILLIDRGSFENPVSYVNRNTYFFSRSANSVHQEAQGAADIDADLLNDAVAQFAYDGGFRKAFQSSSDNLDAGISGLWKSISVTSKACNDLINQICQGRARRVTGEELVEMSPRYKVWVKAMHGALRQRLTYGASSPSTGLVMAVLGHEECMRRLST